MTGERRSLAGSVEGVSDTDLGLRDWGELMLVAGIFGSAFLWISLSLRSISPETIAFGRVGLGAGALALVPAARCRIARSDIPRMLLASTVGVAAPVLLFGLAEERISSALAGMMVAGMPAMAAIVAAIETRRFPERERLAGLTLGLAGVALLAGPTLVGSTAEAGGVAMVALAVLCYAVATTLYAPLQQTYGSLRVTMWVLVFSTIVLFPLGIAGLRSSSIEPLPVIALAILGVIGTGIVWAMFVGMVGRIGAVRSSIAGYLIPIIALVLGVVVLGEQVTPAQLLGIATALAGGYLLSKRTHRATDMPTADEVFAGAPPEHVPPALEMCR